MWILKHDGKEIMRGSEIACWKWLHRNEAASVWHCLKYEGYTLTEEGDGTRESVTNQYIRDCKS